MALTVTLNGSSYSVPEPGDVNYDQALTNYLKALATAFPQLGAGVSQPLTAVWEAGATFGISVPYIVSPTASPATTGNLRLAKSDSIDWRNNANSVDLALKIDGSDDLIFNGSIVTGNPLLTANTFAAQSIPNGGTEAIVKFDQVGLDTDTGYNASTGRYTVPTGKGGHYFVCAGISYSTAPTGTCTCSIYWQGSIFQSTQFIAPAVQQTITVAAILPNAAASTVIDIRTKHGNGAAQTLQANAVLNWISIKRLGS